MAWTMETPIKSKSTGQPLYNWNLSVKSEGLLRFFERVCEHVDESNWKNIILVPDSTGTVRNLLTEYGKLTSADL